MALGTLLSETSPLPNLQPSPSFAGIAITIAAILLTQSLLSRGQGSLFATWSVALPLLLLAAASSVWLTFVSALVPEPYLDEVFHIPQAQKYCEGKFLEWDDKITTPPGLYILTILAPYAAKLTGQTQVVLCDSQTLRAGNIGGLLALSYLAFLCRHHVEARLHEEHSPTELRIRSQYSLHTAFNIGLFPLLFFFSGLYYTDVLSTAAVLAAYLNHLIRIGRGPRSMLSDVLAVFLGLFALLMRQTNIFWVVVYIGGLEAVHAVKTLRPARVDQPFMDTLAAQLKFYAWRYSVGEIHDVPLHDAYPEDMLFSIISLVIAALCNPMRVMRHVWPYIVVLVAFAVFVLWNGGVVLGDKSNHVATIHLAQMLYIWPLFAFFSLPLLLPYVLGPLNIAIRVFRTLHDLLRQTLAPPQAAVPTPTPTGTNATSASPAPSPGRKVGSSAKGRIGRRGGSPPAWRAIYDARRARMSGPLKLVTNLLQRTEIVWPGYLLLTVIASVAIVKFNTIVHPFTLADNRHYMFYVFRYTIRRAAWIRYLLVLPYTFSRWMTWGTMAGCSEWLIYSHTAGCSSYYTRSNDTSFRNNPLWVDLTDIKQQPRGQYLVLPSPASPEEATQQEQAMKRAHAQDPLIFSVEGPPTSTGLIFLLATALSLITAPLVEPRYFIIPWVMWRLLVPAWRAHDHEGLPVLRGLSRHRQLGWLVRLFRRYDLRVVLETAWFVTINLVTGYVFLYKPFQWRAEDGTLLDEGRLQRFMW